MNAMAGQTFGAIIEQIEASYEFMLAYAAQGREAEPVGAQGPSIRGFLAELAAALAALPSASAAMLSLVPTDSRPSVTAFQSTLAADAGRAKQAVDLVLSVPSISSQLIDNLNASTHLRCLLTDMFLLDEALAGMVAAESA